MTDTNPHTSEAVRAICARFEFLLTTIGVVKVCLLQNNVESALIMLEPFDLDFQDGEPMAVFPDRQTIDKYASEKLT